MVPTVAVRLAIEIELTKRFRLGYDRTHIGREARIRYIRIEDIETCAAN